MTPNITTHEEYSAFVEELARAGVILGETAETMARQAIVAPGPIVGDEGRAFYFGLADDILATGEITMTPGERIYPSDVLRLDDRYPYPPQMGDSLDEIAVSSMAYDIEVAMREVEAREDHYEGLEGKPYSQKVEERSP